jgi:hypothetical protein
MISVRNRRMIVPPEERWLGVEGDTYSSIRVFTIPRYDTLDIDLSSLLFNINFLYKDVTTYYKPLEKIYTDDNILLTWTIENSDISSAGTLLLQITAEDGNGSVKWASFKEHFYVGDLINKQDSYIKGTISSGVSYPTISYPNQIFYKIL